MANKNLKNISKEIDKEIKTRKIKPYATLSQILKQVNVEYEWIDKDFVCREHATIFFGDGGTLKTSFTIERLNHWLSKIKPNEKILFVICEKLKSTVSQIYDYFKGNIPKDENGNDRVIFAVRKKGRKGRKQYDFDFCQKDHFERFEDILNDLDAENIIGMVVIDSLSTAFSKLDEAAGKNFQDLIRLICENYKCALVAIGHIVKNQEVIGASKLYGTGRQRFAADHCIEFERDKYDPNIKKIKIPKSNIMEERNIPFIEITKKKNDKPGVEIFLLDPDDDQQSPQNLLKHAIDFIKNYFQPKIRDFKTPATKIYKEYYKETKKDEPDLTLDAASKRCQRARKKLSKKIDCKKMKYENKTQSVWIKIKSWRA